MPATNFLSMKTTIQSMVNRGDEELNNIGSSVVAAIRFYERKRLWFNETIVENLTLSVSNSSLSLPVNFKKEILGRVTVNGQWRGKGRGFEKTSFEKLKNEIFLDPNATGFPENWAIFGNTIYVDKLADQDYTLGLAYVYGDTSLPSADGDISIWFDEARDLIRYYAAGLYYQDYLHGEEKAQFYFGKANEWMRNLTDDFVNRETELELE